MNGEKNLIMGTGPMEIGVILIIRVSPFKSSKLGGNGGNYPPMWDRIRRHWRLGGPIAMWGDYLVNRRVAAEYRDARRSGDIDAFWSSPKTNLYTRYIGKKRRAIGRSESHLWEYKSNFGSFWMGRFGTRVVEWHMWGVGFGKRICGKSDRRLWTKKNG